MEVCSEEKFNLISGHEKNNDGTNYNNWKIYATALCILKKSLNIIIIWSLCRKIQIVGHYLPTNSNCLDPFSVYVKLCPIEEMLVPFHESEVLLFVKIRKNTCFSIICSHKWFWNLVSNEIFCKIERHQGLLRIQKKRILFYVEKKTKMVLESKPFSVTLL